MKRNDVLRFIIKHRSLEKFFSHFRWYRNLVKKRAQEIIIESTTVTLTEFMDERYKNREDKDNIFGVGISDAEFRRFIIDYLLGEDWYVVDPIGQTQINEIALYEILEKYSKRYRKECKGRKRGMRWED